MKYSLLGSLRCHNAGLSTKDLNACLTPCFFIYTKVNLSHSIGEQNEAAVKSIAGRNSLQIFPTKHPPTYHDGEQVRDHGKNDIHDGAKVG